MYFTKREIRNIGYNRFLSEKGRYYKTLIFMFVALFVAVGFDILTRSHLLDGLRVFIAIIIVLSGIIPFIKYVTIDAEKAGKKFLQEWEQEHGEVPEK